MFHFKRTVMALALAASFMSVGSANAFVGSETHNVTISGNLISNPCVVNVSNLVDFGDINVETLPVISDIGVTGTTKTLDIHFQGCNSGQQAQVSLSGTADSADSTLLGNTSTEDAATNVAVGFWQEDGTDKQLAVNAGSSNAHVVDGSSYDNSVMTFNVRLVKPENKAATIGAFTTRAQIKITYL
jgi:type 1 fimbria pilin